MLFQSIRDRLRTAPFALLLLAACGGSDEPIRLGLVGPLTQGNGRSMQRGAEMAVEELNRAGGVEGRQLALVAYDDSASTEAAVHAATRLRDDPTVIAVVGHTTSAPTLAAAPVYNTPGNGVVELSPSASSTTISTAGEWTFRMCPTDMLHGPALADLARRLGATRVAVVYANDNYGRDVIQSFGRAFSDAGGQITSLNPYLPGTFATPTGIDPYLARALRDNAQALMIAGQATEGVQIVRAARRLGFRGPILGPDGMTGLRNEGALAEGVFISSAWLPDRTAQDAQAFVRAYQAKFNELPDHRAAMAYDAVRLLAREIDAAGANSNDLRERLRDRLARVRADGTPYDGVTGRTAVDEQGDVVGKEVTIGVVRSGALVTARN